MNAPTGSTTTAAAVESEEPLSSGFDAATKDDVEFAEHFRHCFTTIDDVQMHYVIGGDGPQVMVLLHGWPHSWYVYREIMPSLLPGRTVIAIDLPGMGDSTGNPPSMARTVLATYVHRLLNHLGYRENVQVVAHDFGAGVAYPLAAQYRRQVAGLFLMDYTVVGKNAKAADLTSLSFHFSFNQQNPLAEELVTDRVETFLTRCFQSMKSGVGEPVSDSELTEYVRVFSRSQVLHAGFELYRVWDQDETENAELQATPLTIPVRLLTQSGLVSFMLPSLKDCAPEATGSDVPGAGHFLVHEAPDRVLAEINAFYPTR
ncbi:alpha/beta hydrolase fold protein [Streptomyces bingchenggensis BCW-1]|uniref:Alpha/beta hydrolase fold protein n=1 Tax=Streptomyces bingchenggensis (strain BCW-1) TaxID=749414 RepID=D7BW53_STRBB|nr:MULTISPECIES: alpha/beta hydrolase [Streptomyces]ADI11763.1 alpha/beta hydrolase fold protein [Streptomyces bingchenggensis BCW-1]